MFDIIQQIINHSWDSYGGDQSYIYYICGAVIVLLIGLLADMIYRIFSNFWR